MAEDARVEVGAQLGDRTRHVAVEDGEELGVGGGDDVVQQHQVAARHQGLVLVGGERRQRLHLLVALQQRRLLREVVADVVRGDGEILHGHTDAAVVEVEHGQSSAVPVQVPDVQVGVQRLTRGACEQRVVVTLDVRSRGLDHGVCIVVEQPVFATQVVGHVHQDRVDRGQVGAFRQRPLRAVLVQDRRRPTGGPHLLVRRLHAQRATREPREQGSRQLAAEVGTEHVRHQRATAGALRGRHPQLGVGGEGCQPGHLGGDVRVRAARVHVHAQGVAGAVGGVDPERGVEAVLHQSQTGDLDRIGAQRLHRGGAQARHLAPHGSFLELHRRQPSGASRRGTASFRRGWCSPCSPHRTRRRPAPSTTASPVRSVRRSPCAPRCCATGRPSPARRARRPSRGRRPPAGR